jgi:hypothetical protein
VSLTSFANPVMLPVFIDDVEQPAILCGGAIYHSYPYDGFINKVELTPIRHDPRFIGAMESNAVGQAYTIGERHLGRLLAAAEWPLGIECAECGRHSYGVRASKATVCCNVHVQGGINTLADLREVANA